ncbi:TerC family protein [Hyalangium rubrum]|uniref:TerC family protein n=1 Tax=Hyalangium rubrum TaxID=3103134 RepID=A0ABU5H7T5_9BACT|nr:TerC family protein [Hyalangium sp. s54d21]MDY7229503.1 TerC family protein [Hyalangium sp. s54d21]
MALETTTSNPWVALLTLSAMEIVLGVDNIVFIAILVAKLPPDKRERIRKLGIGLALIIRIGLLFALSWLMRLTEPLFTVLGEGISGRDLILLGGGLFLVAKSVHEMHSKLEGPDIEGTTQAPSAAAVGSVLAQILALDIVFSLDSVITAVGMASQLWVMVTAMIIAVGVMLIFAGRIGDFVERHPTVKILALSFLLLIGVMLVAEGLGQHINKGYIYFAMAFALVVELLNMRLRKVHKPVHLHAGTEQKVASELGR